MVFFNGIDNNSSVFETYEFRRFSKELTREGFRGPTDFWYDDYLYGRINKENDVVFLSEAFLKEIRTNNSKTIFTLNFIADALSDMKADFEQIKQSRLSENSDISAITPYLAWEPLHDKYHQFMTNSRLIFSKAMNPSSLQNFYDFWIQYRAHLEARNYPFTRTAFIKSKYYPINNTGLFIYLFKVSSSDDQEKAAFVRDRNFNFYYRFVKKYGFVVDTFNPGRIVADLKSAPMQKYMKQYDDTTFDTLFDKYYYKASEMDYQTFKKYALALFNDQLTKEYDHKRVTEDGIGDTYLFKEYISVRLKEEQIPSDPSFERKCLKLFGRSGIIPATELLNNKIKRFHASVPNDR